MKLIEKSPGQSTRSLLRNKPTRKEIDLFKDNLVTLFTKLSVIKDQGTEESEEHLKNNLRDFLRDTYYNKSHSINTKDRQDLVIHLDANSSSQAGVILEVKRPTNKLEMITAQDPNRKALHELILYYLNERVKNDNNQVKHLVITNIHEWYVIDANYFDKHIFRNTRIRKLYDLKLNDKKDSPFFYEEIKKIVGDMDVEIPCTHFDIRDYEASIRGQDGNKDKELISLFKIFSPQYLLKEGTANDNNTLNHNFYKELLYLLGLEESKLGGKRIIKRADKNRCSGSLIEMAIDALNTNSSFKHIENLSLYGTTKAERDFNIALELCITWLNRILFIKLLEGQVVNYHSGDKDFKFLNIDRVSDFDELFKLFHKVLAVEPSKRSPSVRDKYGAIPYLNSSLFDITKLEDMTIRINSLDNNELIPLRKGSTLKESTGGKPELQTLEYIFSFLDSYDFSSEGSYEIQEDNKQLITASVLGKVFEKINGYKDGSVFTPSFITMYMSRQSIRLAVVKLFNERIKDKIEARFESFEDLKNYTSRLNNQKDILEANLVVNSLKLCDPAVGSGHFLVSSLNEIIVIKSELGILADRWGNTISNYEVDVVNDEIIITDPRGSFLEYKIKDGLPTSKNAQHLQETLFHEKQNIIENCLFGVDINPNSVKICRLRLWIELLKNAYYKESTGYAELETLPNIDINIKCGNSLLSRFNVNENLSTPLKKIKISTSQYRDYVHQYKNAQSKDAKEKLEDIIDNIKSNLRTEIGINDPKRVQLQKLKNDLLLLNHQAGIFELDHSEERMKNDKKKQLSNDIKNLENSIEKISNNALFKSAFEWRFEFPEVLDNEGEYIGFDVVIGNPPYIRIDDIDTDSRIYFKNSFRVASGKYDIYYLFYEKSLEILKDNGELSFITPNRFTATDSGLKLRELLLNSFENLFVNSVSKISVFDTASTYPAIIQLSNKGKEAKCLKMKESVSVEDVESVDNTETYELSDILNMPLKIIPLNSDKRIIDLYLNIIRGSEKLKDYLKIQEGLRIPTKDESENGDFAIVKQYQFSRYSEVTSGSRIEEDVLSRSVSMKSDRFLNCLKDKILVAEDSLQISATIDYSGAICQGGVYFATTKTEKSVDLRFILALINSKLLNAFYNNLFSGMHMGGGYLRYRSGFLYELPVRVPKDCSEYIVLVENILSKREKGLDSSAYEDELDELVYNLFELSSEEVNLIKNT